MVSSAQKQKAVLSGPALINVLLEETSRFLQQCPDHEYSGTPSEIVEAVVLSSTRFGECGDDCLSKLTRQLAMAIQHKGRPYHLRYEMLSKGKIKVAFG